jgi:pimeloyl-ACP methyl ester carboxylesterase
MDGRGLLLEPLLARLRRSHEVRVLQLPDAGPQTYRALDDHVQGLLPRDREPYALVAESFSGPLALRLAAGEPTGLAAVVLVNSFVARPVGLLSALGASVGVPWLSRLGLAQRLAAGPMLGADAPPELLAALSRELSRVPAATLGARLRTLATANETPAYLHTQLPIFYLRGEQDRLVDESALRTLIGLRPGLQLQRIEGPHLLLQRHPEACAAALISMLNDFELG